ncbi:MAG TPA: Si-specific NAD(P)(+) transhydrogenase [Gaiellales bacterium]|nr:Si-specific NAD(P)(+) transhydrogenase [Gaiellales bacterium]
MEGSRFDLVVLGSGPAGQKAAIQAAKVGASVAVVECRDTIGGVCANTGTIPSKTLREAAVYLTGLSERGLYGQSYRVKDEITIDDLIWRTQQVMAREVDVIRNQLARNHVQVLTGQGRLADEHRVEVSDLRGSVRTVEADRIVIATGTTPARPPDVEFDEATILDSDGILQMSRIPSTLVVVGAGVIGIEYASIFAALGTRVTVVERRERLLEFCDGQMVEALQYYLRDLGVVFRLGETVTSVEKHDGGTLTALASGKRIAADAVMYSAGRQGATAGLGLEEVGLEIDKRGRIAVDEHYRTAVDHIYAVGDVIGFPSLASSSFEQGRLAAAHAFGLDARPMRELLPIGIYTIPEISFAGRTEEELTGEGVPYEIGISRYRELARAQIQGDQVGILKLLVEPEARTLLGVHAFGTAATELVHIGQTVMGLGGTVDYLIDQVFNYPTLAESYKVAALDATNKLRALNRMTV